jgi:hypothetical protein
MHADQTVFKNFMTNLEKKVSEKKAVICETKLERL